MMLRKNSTRIFAYFLSVVLISNCTSLGLLVTANAAGTKTNEIVEAFGEGGNGGFALTKNRHISEVDSDMLMFSHVKSGAKVVLLENDDNNKAFSIGFKTPMSDNSGVNNIIQQSILSGSKKYELKSPMTNMKSRSLNKTMEFKTGQDKTTFSFSSKSAEDLNNLIDVCADGIFNSLILDKEEIIMSNGAYKEPYVGKGKDNKAMLKFHYMGEGYQKSLDSLYEKTSVMDNGIRKSIFPNTQYRFNPLGVPEEVAELDKSKLINDYQKYFVPSNSLVYLYGNFNKDELITIMTTLNSYFSAYNNSELNITVAKQTAFTKRNKENAFYEGNANYSNNVDFTKNYVICDLTENREDIIGIQLLSDILFGNENSILSKTMQDNGVEFVSGEFVKNILQPYFSIKVMNVDPVKTNNIDKLIDVTLGSIAEKGFQESDIKNTFEKVAAKYESLGDYKERGLSYVDNIMNGLYGIEPEAYIATSDVIANIREALVNHQKYFENLINKYFINNKHASTIIFSKKSGLKAIKADAMLQAEEAKAQALTAQNWNEIKSSYNKLVIRQDTPDFPEQLAILPAISPEGVADSLSIPIGTQENMYGNITILKYQQPYGKRMNVNVYFDASKIPLTQASYLNLYANLLGKVDTLHYTLPELKKKVDNTFQSLTFGVRAFGDASNVAKINPKFMVQFETDESKLAEALDLIGEILINTNWDSTDTIRNEMVNMQSSYNLVFKLIPDVMLANRVFAGTSDAAKYNELSKNDMRLFLSEINAAFNWYVRDIRSNLLSVQEKITNKNGMLISFSGADSIYTAFKNSMTGLVDKLGTQILSDSGTVFNEDTTARQGFEMDKQGYLKMFCGFNLRGKGYSYNGVMPVAKEILNDIIKKNSLFADGVNNAYMTINQSGNISIKCVGTAEAEDYKKALLYSVYKLSTIELSSETLNEYKRKALVSVFGTTDNVEAVTKSDTNYMWGIADSEQNMEKAQMLGATQEMVWQQAHLFTELILNGNVIAIGDYQKLSKIPLDSIEFISK